MSRTKNFCRLQLHPHYDSNAEMQKKKKKRLTKHADSGSNRFSTMHHT